MSSENTEYECKFCHQLFSGQSERDRHELAELSPLEIKRGTVADYEGVCVECGHPVLRREAEYDGNDFWHTECRIEIEEQENW